MTAALALVVFFFAIQVVCTILDAKGKVVPEILSIRAWRRRKREEREMLREACRAIPEMKGAFESMLVHYSADNITKRNEWMQSVDSRISCHDDQVKAFVEKLDRNHRDVLDILIENKRSAIIGFADKVIDGKSPVTREQFTRVLRLHQEYEELIAANGMTNGEVDIAYRIITEAYEQHMRDHSFVEDVRWR